MGSGVQSMDMTWTEISKLIVFVAAAAGVLAGIWKGVEAWRHLSGQVKREKEMSNMENSIRGLQQDVGAIKDHLKEHDKLFEESDQRFESLDKGMNQILKTQTALIDFFADGASNTEKLQAIRKENRDFLIDRD